VFIDIDSTSFNRSSKIPAVMKNFHLLLRSTHHLDLLFYIIYETNVREQE
jgi:hypothetical protein